MTCVRTIAAAATLAASVSLTSCETFEDTVVDPFGGAGRFFTMYGFLDAAALEHQIRVIPVRRSPEDITSPTDRNAFIDAEVASTDLETGRRIVWRHQLTPLTDGNLAHVYFAAIRIEPGHPYRIDVTRSDGAQSSATTVVPTLSTSIEPAVEEPVASFGDVFQTVHLTGVSRVVDIDVFYIVSDGGRQFARVVRPYGKSGRIAATGSWSFTLDLSRDAALVMQEAEPELGSNIFLHEIGVDVRWIDDQWPFLDGPVDIDRLAQPGVLSNVENGEGFVGSIGTYLRSWPVDSPELKAQLGFQ